MECLDDGADELITEGERVTKDRCTEALIHELQLCHQASLRWVVLGLGTWFSKNLHDVVKYFFPCIYNDVIVKSESCLGYLHSVAANSGGTLAR